MKYSRLTFIPALLFIFFAASALAGKPSHSYQEAALWYARQLYGEVTLIETTPWYNLKGEVEVYACVFQQNTDTRVTLLAGAHAGQPPVIGGHHGMPLHQSTHGFVLKALQQSPQYQNWHPGRVIYIDYSRIYYEILPESRTHAAGRPEYGIHLSSMKVTPFSPLQEIAKQSYDKQWQRFSDPDQETFKAVSLPKRFQPASASDSSANLRPWYIEGADDLIILSNDSRPLSDSEVYATNAVKIWFGLQNNGGEAVFQNYEINFYVNNVLAYTYHPWFDLESGQSLLWFFRHTFPYPGQYFIKMVIDPENAVDENDETDNVYERTISVSNWVVDEYILSDVPGYNQTSTDCGPVAAAKVLAYWDTHAFHGQTYWNIVDHGNALTGNLSPIAGDTANTGLVQDLRKASCWRETLGTLADSLTAGIESVCNDTEYGNELAFQAVFNNAPTFDHLKKEIIQNKPLLYGVNNHYLYSNHSMAAVGYRETPLDQIVWVKDNYHGDEMVWLNWLEADKSLITVTPGGIPHDHYEPDNLPEQAHRMDPDDFHNDLQTHNFIQSDDVDWIYFPVSSFRHYSIITSALGSACDTEIMLIADEDTLYNQDYKGSMSRIDWFVTVPTDTLARVAVRNSNGLAGPDTHYDIQIAYSDLPQYYLDLRNSPAIAGKIQMNPDTCIVDKNADILIHAIPNPGYVFHHWEGALSGQQNPQPLMVNEKKYIKACYTSSCPDMQITSLAEAYPSQGCAFGDYDGDGDMDLFVANDENQPNQLLNNRGNGCFDPVLTGPVVQDSYPSIGGCWGDYDNDGDLDLFVVNKNGANNQLYENTGLGQFQRITQGPVVNDGGSSTHGCWIDYNGDQFIDLFVTNKNNENNFLYQNSGLGEFNKIATGAIVSDGGDSRSASWGDFDNDGDPDLFVANAAGQTNRIYINNSNGTFTPLENSPVVEDIAYSWSGSWVDYDNDRDLDLFVVNSNQTHQLYENTNHTFKAVTMPGLTENASHARGAGWADFDCDGDVDLFVNNRSGGSQLYFQEENGFVPCFTGFSDARGGAWHDADADGDMDLYITQYGAENLYIENQLSSLNWIQFSILDGAAGPISRGAKVDILIHEDDPLWQTREIHRQQGLGGCNEKAHFGLNTADAIDSLVIQWPDGRRVLRGSLAGNQTYHFIKPHGNVSPVARDDTFYIASDDSLILNVLTNDQDADQDRLTLISIDTAQTLGRCMIGQKDTCIVYWPEKDFEGDDSFRYIVSDQQGGMDTALVCLTTELNRVAHAAALPVSCRLHPNYPNPFNPETWIRFDLNQSGLVKLAIYNTSGHLVAVLRDERTEAGCHALLWQAKNRHGDSVASGLYICVLKTEDQIQTQKMLFVR